MRSRTIDSLIFIAFTLLLRGAVSRDFGLPSLLRLSINSATDNTGEIRKSVKAKLSQQKRTAGVKNELKRSRVSQKSKSSRGSQPS